MIDQVKAQKSVLDDPEFKASGIDLVAYEGGQHLTTDTLPSDLKASLTPQKKRELIQLIHEANNSPKMGELYATLFNGWEEAGGKTHVNFIMAQGQSQYGSFGMSPTLNDKNSSAKYNTIEIYADRFCRGVVSQ